MNNKKINKLLILTSTFPINEKDQVPQFVYEQAVAFKKTYPELNINILAPHTPFTIKAKSLPNKPFREYRFNYFWPRKFQLLTGNGIMPALKNNPLLYLQIPFLFFFEFIALLKITRREKPDLIYAHWFAPQAINAYLVSKITKIPFAFTTHASDIISLRKIPGIKKLLTKICDSAIGYTAVSPETARKMSVVAGDKYRKIQKKLKIIPMGTNKISDSSKETISKVKKKYNPDDKQIILYIGRLASIKGVDLLIESINKIQKKNKNVKLIIAGDGNELKKLESRVKNLNLNKGIVEFVGFVNGEEKNSLLKMSDYICIPSRKEGVHSEGLPVVLMEALSVKSIIIASDVSGAQFVIEDEKSGFIFKQNNVRSLELKLTEALNLSDSTKKTMSKSAKQLAIQFQWDKVIQEHYNFFLERLNEKL